jgi:hypothetical protein
MVNGCSKFQFESSHILFYHKSELSEKETCKTDEFENSEGDQKFRRWPTHLSVVLLPSVSTIPHVPLKKTRVLLIGRN